MSKVGRLNLELQEQANELGFSTVQEALDNGCVVGTELFGDAPRLIKPIDMQKELEKAHEAWLKEKEEVIKGLQYVATQTTGAKEEYVRKAIEFIERGEV